MLETVRGAVRRLLKKKSGIAPFNAIIIIILLLLVKASASRVEDSGSESRLRRGDFSGSSHNSDLKIGTPVVILPGAWRDRVSVGTGRSVSVCYDWMKYKVWSATSVSV